MTEKAQNPLHAALISNLRALMEARGENPTSLAIKAGLNNRAVHDILQGRSLHPRADTLRALSIALSSPPDALLSLRPIDPEQNFGTGPLGNLGGAGDMLAAAYHHAPRLLDGATAYPAPAFLTALDDSAAADLVMARAPAPAFPPHVAADAWVVVDLAQKQVRTAGLYWVGKNKQGFIAQITPAFGSDTALSVTLFGAGAQTVQPRNLTVRGRIISVLQPL